MDIRRLNILTVRWKKPSFAGGLGYGCEFEHIVIFDVIDI